MLVSQLEPMVKGRNITESGAISNSLTVREYDLNQKPMFRKQVFFIKAVLFPPVPK